MMDSETVKQAVADGLITETDTTPEKFKTLREAIRNGEHLSDGLVLRMLETHVREYKESRENWDQEIPKMLDNVKGRIQALIEAGVLPPEAAQALGRLDGLDIRIVDPVNANQEGQRGHGAFSPDDNQLEIQYLLSYFPDLQQTIFTHEITHALSGKSAGIDETGKIKHVRNGLSSRDGKYVWLDEALTHKLSKELVGAEAEKMEEHDYDEFVELMRLLSDRVPEKLFYAAYFENDDAQLPSEERRKNWKALNDAVDQAFGPGFLKKLDDLMREGQAKKAIALLSGQ
ncbi:hypothetical protein ACFLZO_00485 [Patescibacteria group bacterium]